MENNLHTIRGTFDWHVGVNVDPVAPRRLLLDNGNFNQNFIVESFEVFPTGTEAISHDAFSAQPTLAVLATRENAAVAADGAPWEIEGMRVNDDRQIGWSMWTYQMQVEKIDPNHLIVEDLWVNCWVVNQATGVLYLPNQAIGYIIKLKAVKTTTFEAIMSLIKARAQDDSGEHP